MIYFEKLLLKKMKLEGTTLIQSEMKNAETDPATHM
jgi:hypothetical protein